MTTDCAYLERAIKLQAGPGLIGPEPIGRRREAIEEWLRVGD
jgi:hypothetical protein